MKGFAPTPAIDRLFERLCWDGDCLIFEGATTKWGYGVIRERVDGKRTMTGAHVIVYRDTVGPVPQGLLICHTCDNPPCCNPEHLWCGTPSENMYDKVAKGRASNGRDRWTHCVEGHEFTPENTITWGGRRSCRTCRNQEARDRRRK